MVRNGLPAFGSSTLVLIGFAVISMIVTFLCELAGVDNEGKNAAADDLVRSNGFNLHDRYSDCLDGCQICTQVRLAAGWPQGVRLLRDPTKLRKSELEAVILHYSLKLDDPATGS